MSERPVDFDAPLSASKLKQYAHCPEAFRLGYIDRYPELGDTNRYIRRGDAVHEAIEDTLTDPPGQWDESFVRHRLTEAYRANGGRDEYNLSEDDDEFVRDCLGVAARYLADRAPDVVAVEAEVSFTAANLDYPPGFTGYIDLVTPEAVVDWKTGSSDDKDLDETLQGGVYMAGYLDAMGHPPDRIEFAYLKEGDVHTIQPGDEVWDTVSEKAAQVLDAIETGRFPADPEDSKCYWCDYEPFCGASPVGVGGVGWEVYP